MSILYCTECGEYFDTDFETSEEHERYCAHEDPEPQGDFSGSNENEDFGGR